ncbi:hypothetical protein PMAYCL1PPCAC_32962 [Pristionchus mayeri]|uniref:Nuclear receptor domain-containing protein n=1 Tax=Pristionchus mayeri TaxID=1317129 RepID=A0AAN5DIA5_9BILA|nr:hypothetical protein PMAYCL1PPCAC_32962 [Pristionchus mayeri]
MIGMNEGRKCLICFTSAGRCRLGIDCCRACAVFYKRLLTSKRMPYECISEDGKCAERGAILACRKCRFKRFSEVLKRADSSSCEEIHIEDNSTNVSYDSSIELLELGFKSNSFIDHNTFSLNLPKSSSTPLLDKIRWGYSALSANLQRTKSINRNLYNRVKPDSVEFTALLGLAFWNNGVASINDELLTAVQKNRRVILSELHNVYMSRGTTDYAARLGDLLCLLSVMEENVTLSVHKMKFIDTSAILKSVT